MTENARSLTHATGMLEEEAEKGWKIASYAAER